MPFDPQRGHSGIAAMLRFGIKSMPVNSHQQDLSASLTDPPLHIAAVQGRACRMGGKHDMQNSADPSGSGLIWHSARV